MHPLFHIGKAGFIGQVEAINSRVRIGVKHLAEFIILWFARCVPETKARFLKKVPFFYKWVFWDLINPGQLRQKSPKNMAIFGYLRIAL